MSSLQKQYERESIEDAIISAFRDNRKITNTTLTKVFIESGSANDEIVDYNLTINESNLKYERTVSFTTSGCIFPKIINLSMYDNVNLEKYNGNLFIQVW